MTKNQQQPQAAPRRRWFVIGPGVLIAVILGLQIAIANHRTTSAPPIVERQVLGARTDTVSAPAYEISVILGHAKDLRLSDSQSSSLKKLQAEWIAISKPLTEEMNRSAADFDEFMARANGRATLSEVQSHAGPVSEASRQVASVRRGYWQRALRVLDPQQREALKRAVTIRPTGKSIVVEGKSGVTNR